MNFCVGLSDAFLQTERENRSMGSQHRARNTLDLSGVCERPFKTFLAGMVALRRAYPDVTVGLDISQGGSGRDTSRWLKRYDGLRLCIRTVIFQDLVISLGFVVCLESA